jgi:hypothetical protein
MWCRTLRCIVILTLSLLVAPHTVEAQQVGKVWRVGLLEYTPIPERSLPEAFRTELRNLGYVEGKNIASSSSARPRGESTGWGPWRPS